MLMLKVNVVGNENSWAGANKCEWKLVTTFKTRVNIF